MLKEEELKFLEYLDYAVEYQKELDKVIKSTGTPFSVDKINSCVDEFENNKIKTIQQATKKMIANKALKNTILRRNFKVFVREGFDNIDFSKLKNNPAYVILKSKLLKGYDDIQNIDDKDFLKQIANSIAHGDYLSFLKINDIENRWGVNKSDKSLDTIKDYDSGFNFVSLLGGDTRGFDDNVKSVLSGVNKKAGIVSLTPLQMYMKLLEGKTYDGERLKINYTSRYSFNESGEKTKRDKPLDIELDLSAVDLDNIMSILVSHAGDKKYIALNPKDTKTRLIMNEDSTHEEDAEALLDFNNVGIFSGNFRTFEPIELDEHQKDYFISEYANSREMFSREYYKPRYITREFTDIMSSNATPQMLELSYMLTNAKLDKLSYPHLLLNTDYKTYFNFVNNVFSVIGCKDIMSMVGQETKKSYAYKQVYYTYTESLITEILLLLQILEDSGKATRLDGNEVLLKLVNNINSFGGDYSEQTMLKKLRNSLTHLSYLTNSKDEIFIYDQKSNKDKNLEYKFTLDISSLELIKNELYNFIKTHLPEKISEEPCM